MNYKGLRWAVHPADIERVAQLPGISSMVAAGIPEEGQTITHPFLVDPKTKAPIPVIISQVILGMPEPDLVTVVVTRGQ
jgi:hypothetical protein